jgi:hypothetical protein
MFNRASVSSRFGFRFAIGLQSVVVCVVGFRPGTRPSPARPGPARSSVPLAPPTPHVCPLSLSLIWFSHASTPSPFLPPLSHLFALGDPVDGYRRILDPKVSLPLPPSSRALSLGRVPSLPRRPWPPRLPGALSPGRALPGALGPRPRPSLVR